MRLRSFAKHAALFVIEQCDPLRSQWKKLVELCLVEGSALAGPLHFHEPTFAAHYDVHVYFGADIEIIVEIQAGHAIDDSDADSGDAPAHRRRRHVAVGDEPPEGVVNSHACTGDRGGAGSTVSLEDVAVHANGELSEREVIDHGANAPTNESLNFLRAAAELRSLAGRAGSRGAGQHCVLGGDPALTFALLPPGDR